MPLAGAMMPLAGDMMPLAGDMMPLVRDHQLQMTGFSLQALLTGLTVMTPRDPWQFVIQSLAHIRDTDITDIPRSAVPGPSPSLCTTSFALPYPLPCSDIFVDLASQPLLQRNPLRSLLTDSDHIDEDQLEAAYQFRGRQLYRWSFK